MCPRRRTRIFPGALRRHAARGFEAAPAFAGYAGKRRAICSAGSARAAEDNGFKNEWQKCHGQQKRKFFFKKQKKRSLLMRRIFCDCISQALGVLYYGCFGAEKRAGNEQEKIFVTDHAI